jgi:hypothetical protein
MGLSTTQMSIEKHYYDLLNRLRSAENRFGRTPGSVCLVAVSKTRTPDTIRQIAALNQEDFGENQVQEAISKLAKLSDLKCVWHFIGSIQTNKCRDIATHFDWVHSVDRLKVAERLSSLRRATAQPLNLFLQVNLQGEATKSGVALGDLTSLAHKVNQLPNLHLRGLMAIPAPEQNFQKQCKVFRQLNELQVSLNHRLNLTLDSLSMGMTDDLEAAVSEGATHVRIGTAIFGLREDQKYSKSKDSEHEHLT